MTQKKMQRRARALERFKILPAKGATKDEYDKYLERKNIEKASLESNRL